MSELFQSNSRIILVSVLLLVATFVGSNNIYALTVSPANSTIKSSLDNALKSITSNVSKSIQGDLDKILSDTMDIQIKNVLEQLSNATIIGNNGQSVPKFQANIPSGINVFERDGHVSSVQHPK